MSANELSEWPAALREGFNLPDVIGLPPAEVARTVIEAVAHHLESSASVRQFLADLPKGEGTCCPDDPIDELISHVARMMGAKGINKNDPLVTLGWTRHIMSPVFQFEREALGRAFWRQTESGELSLVSDTLLMIGGGINLANAVDQLFLALFEKLVVPYQQLPEIERKEFGAQMSNQLPEYDYTVFGFSRGENGIYVVGERQPWAVALPDEIGEILAIIGQLISTLEDGLIELEQVNYDLIMQSFSTPEDRQNLIHYLYCLYDAYGCTDIEYLETSWQEVDKAWVKLGATPLLLPVHGIETYNHPVAVQPEFRLEIRTPEDRDTIDQVKCATVEIGATLGLSDEMTELIGHRLRNTDTGVFITAIKAGFNLNFPMAGQSAPNRQEVQDIGARIFIAPTREAAALKIYHRLAVTHCDPETAAMAGELITAREQRLHVYGHECAHPLGRTAKIDANLGEMSQELEEAKASMVGYLTLDLIDSSPKTRRARAAATAIRVIRFFQKSAVSNPSVAPYVRENKVAATTLMDAGILSLTPEGVHISWETAEGDQWYQALGHFSRQLLVAYANCDPTRVQELSEEYCHPDRPELQQLIDWCQRPIEETAAAKA